MGKFIPVFDGEISVAVKEKTEKQFEIIYQRNIDYFNGFNGTIEVHFNGNAIPLVKYMTNTTLSHQEIVFHNEKIQALANEALLLSVQ